MVSPRLAADYVTVNNLKQLKLINTRAASLSLDDLVYTAALEHEDLIKLGYFNDIPVGGIMSQKVGDKIQILSLGVLPAYRNFGLGSKLVETVTSSPAAKSSSAFVYIDSTNTKAVDFFKKLGFRENSADFPEKPTDTVALVRPPVPITPQ